MSLVKCAECGHAISAKALTCPKCGCPEPHDKTKRCTECGAASITTNSGSCSECGHPYGISTDVKPSQPKKSEHLAREVEADKNKQWEADFKARMQKADREILIGGVIGGALMALIPTFIAGLVIQLIFNLEPPNSYYVYGIIFLCLSLYFKSTWK